MSVWNLGSARGPFTVKKRPLFDENALKERKRISLQKSAKGAPPRKNCKQPGSLKQPDLGTPS